MSKAVKEQSLTISEDENDSDALSKEISNRLQLDDFVWVDNTSSEVISYENLSESSSETDAEIVKVVQHGTNTESSENAEECQLECNSDAEYSIITPSEWERGLSVEQKYWEKYGSIVKSINICQPKHHASQRLTIKEHGKIDNDKRSNRDPSHYKFDFPTTVVLKTLLEQKYAESYHNIVGKGSNSVVIYAKYPKIPWTQRNHRIYYKNVAVKVYKLSNDVDKNNTIYKRVQREYTHMLLLRSAYIPSVVTRMKNIIVTHFIGEDQETAPTISIVPSGYCRDMYQFIVKELDKWYTKFNLVHGNLRTKNILVLHNNSSYGYRYIPYFIGWSHSVKKDHPQAFVKLLRDCQFVTNFFKKRGVPVKSTEELYKDITGLDEISSKVVDAMHKKDLWQEKHLTNPNRESQKGNSKKHRT